MSLVADSWRHRHCRPSPKNETLRPIAGIMAQLADAKKSRIFLTLGREDTGSL